MEISNILQNEILSKIDMYRALTDRHSFDVNKTMDQSDSLVYSEKRISIIDLALVCKKWFQMVKSQINVIVVEAETKHSIFQGSSGSHRHTTLGKTSHDKESIVILPRSTIENLALTKTMIVSLKQLASPHCILSLDHLSSIHFFNVGPGFTSFPYFKPLMQNMVGREMDLYFYGNYNQDFLDYKKDVQENHKEWSIKEFNPVISRELDPDSIIEFEQFKQEYPDQICGSLDVAVFSEDEEANFDCFKLIQLAKPKKVCIDLLNSSNDNQLHFSYLELAKNHFNFINHLEIKDDFLDALDLVQLLKQPNFKYISVVFGLHCEEDCESFYPVPDHPRRHLPQLKEALETNTTLKTLAIECFCHNPTHTGEDFGIGMESVFDQLLIKNHTLTNLQLDGISPGESFYKSLADPNCSLQYLSLVKNSIPSDDHFKLFAKSLEMNKSIQQLSIQGCNITDKSEKVVSSIIQNNKSITSINLSCTKLTGELIVPVLSDLTKHNIQNISISLEMEDFLERIGTSEYKQNRNLYLLRKPFF
ncbi:hypothetical protein DFA_09052 [Cavenderia fasciculata]|uniref:F-box domain-containing protein n=1 Tax=Cavenderia fasciculata TaxID=261658 RepID=F4Q6K4_CACFS|nr:uncharacterized protein DFA_09052 [Cavenderia fasciculata]EGG16514.1 hypothetical protein DFA_09052 [Cavenderia fasciculata]|eukprot:XP_004354914.1 hypothetical protein DFA_09052 [Cavenderia fasciculata]